MKNVKQTRQLSRVTGLLIFFGILVALNAVVAAFQFRHDLTEEGLYTLSDGTRRMLKGLQRDVTLKFYFSKSAEGTPVPLKQYAQRVIDLLREVERESGGSVLLETYDPKPDSDEEEWAQRYGVTAQSLGLLGGPTLYIGLVGVSGAKEGVLPVLSPQQEPQLEYLVTRLITEITQTKKPKIGVMSSLPVMGGPALPYGAGPQAGSQPWLIIQELRRLYEVTEVDAAADALPDDVATLLLIQPTSLPDTTLFMLDQFLLRGGRIVAFVDPASIAEREMSPQPGFSMGGGDLSGFSKLLGAWGLSLDATKAVADVTYATRVHSNQGGVARNVSWLSLRGDAMNRDEIATGSLDSMLLVSAGAFSGEPPEGVNMTTLLQTSDQAGFVNTFDAGFSPDGGLGSVTPENTPLPLAVRLTGQFKTAFPDGKPVPPGTNTVAAAAKSTADATETLAESERDGAVVLVADADLLYDRFCVRAINFFGQTLHEPLNDNLNFVINMVEQLSGSEALIGLRSRGTYSRPFTRVLKLERQAQSRWQQEEARLQAKLDAAQSKLQALQTEKDPNQQYILSPEQEQEIKQFQEEAFQTKQALKDVRKNLRRDIERMGLQLKVINIALMPLGVAIFGIVLGLRRRRG